MTQRLETGARFADRYEVEAILGEGAMAPEQLRGLAIDARADIYALGCMLYELFTGRLPFAGSTPLPCAFARLNEDPDDPREHAELPAALAELILRCLARDREHRPSRARAVAEAFAQCRMGIGGLPATMPVMRPTAPPPGAFGTLAPHGDAADRRAWGNAPTLRQRDLKLAVLPLRARGGAAAEELAEQVSEEIVDVINLMPGVRVLGIPATERFRETRDPGSVGRELDVHVVVDGRLDGRDPRHKRLVIRLLDVKSGEPLWHARFAIDLDDLLGADAALFWLGAQPMVCAIRELRRIAQRRAEVFWSAV